MKLVQCRKCGANTTNMLTCICDTCKLKKMMERKNDKMDKGTMERDK